MAGYSKDGHGQTPRSAETWTNVLSANKTYDEMLEVIKSKLVGVSSKGSARKPAWLN